MRLPGTEEIAAWNLLLWLFAISNEKAASRETSTGGDKCEMGHFADDVLIRQLCRSSRQLKSPPPGPIVAQRVSSEFQV
jgi:hypothetical protein